MRYTLPLTGHSLTASGSAASPNGGYGFDGATLRGFSRKTPAPLCGACFRCATVGFRSPASAGLTSSIYASFRLLDLRLVSPFRRVIAPRPIRGHCLGRPKARLQKLETGLNCDRIHRALEHWSTGCASWKFAVLYFAAAKLASACAQFTTFHQAFT